MTAETFCEDIAFERKFVGGIIRMRLAVSKGWITHAQLEMFQELLESEVLASIERDILRLSAEATTSPQQGFAGFEFNLYDHQYTVKVHIVVDFQADIPSQQVYCVLAHNVFDMHHLPDRFSLVADPKTPPEVVAMMTTAPLHGRVSYVSVPGASVSDNGGDDYVDSLVRAIDAMVGGGPTVFVQVRRRKRGIFARIADAMLGENLHNRGI